MKVSEVMLSNQGSTSSQFVELEDQFSESFPSSDYALSIFDGTAHPLGSVALTVPANTTRMLIATPAAATQFSVTPAATLNVALPADGQACFDTGSVHIYCLAWGTVGSQVVGMYGNDLGSSPPDGMSLQRLTSGALSLGSPTPGAANTAPVPDASPVTPDAAVPLDAPPPPDDGARPPDAPGPNGNNPTNNDDGCSVGAGASWFGLVALIALVAIGRARRGG